ncbi:MAG: alpha/beta hydrolase, partial [Alcanivoracaceae bacterium]
AGFGGLDPDSCRLLCERGLEQVPGGWTWRTDARLRLTSSLRLTEDQVEGFMRAITVPTLLVTAEQGMGGNGMFDHRTAWLSDLEQVRLPGRHHVHMEQAAAVAAPVARFLAQ